MDSEAISAVRQLFKEIDAAIPRESESQTKRARQVFDLLEHDGGGVYALDQPSYQRTRIDELGTWTDDPWDGPTYGVDASTSPPN